MRALSAGIAARRGGCFRCLVAIVAFGTRQMGCANALDNNGAGGAGGAGGASPGAGRAGGGRFLGVLPGRAGWGREGGGGRYVPEGSEHRELCRTVCNVSE